jgi:hypothetical protein
MRAARHGNSVTIPTCDPSCKEGLVFGRKFSIRAKVHAPRIAYIKVNAAGVLSGVINCSLT